MRDQTLRILHVTTSFPQDSGDFSGLFVYQLIQALEINGVLCHILTPAGLSPTSWPESHRISRFRYAPWKWQQLAQQPGGIPQALNQNPFFHCILPSFAFSMAVHLVRLARHYDLIHAHWSISGALAALTQPIHRKPIITTLRGSDMHKAKVSDMYAWIHRKAIWGSRSTVGVSYQIVKELKKSYPAVSGRFSFIANGVSDLFYSISPTARPIPPPLKFLFVGSLIQLKGVDLLLNAFAASGQKWQLTVAGDGSEMTGLTRLTQALHISDRVSFLGAVPQWKVPSLMADHHVLVLPSHREGRPNVVLEAMASALPVVATDIDGTRELVQHGRTGWLVPPNDSKALADVIRSLIGYEKDLVTVGIAGRQRISELDLTWSKAAKHYHKLYEKALTSYEIFA